MKDKNLDNENLEDLERNEDLTSKSEDFVDEDVVFEELNANGDVMSEREKNKSDKNKLKDKFEHKIENLEKERDEYLRGWQRIQADYKNREKEIEADKKRTIEFANSNLMKDILPVLDGYDMARTNKEQWESVSKDWRIGVEYLFSQLLDVLGDNGMKTFGKVGEEYDPLFHEAIEIVKVEEKGENDKIVNVIQKGYKIGEKILRPARVKVGHFEK